MRKNSELSKPEIIQVFSQNFNYPIEHTILGDAVRMPSRDAFIFCNVTGAGYLDDFIFPFTPKGLMKLFYNAFDYKFVSGIFEKTSLKYTPFLISRWKPFVFNSEYKYIVPVEFNSEVELQDYLEDVFHKLETPTDYVIMRVETSKKGNGLESFMEYLTAEYFKRNGFIVENQVPLAHAIGSPDFGGYDIDSIQIATKKYLPSGFHIIELAMIRLNLKGAEYKVSNTSNGDLIVGEAKTSTVEMDGQLRKYLNTGLFDWGLEIHPNKPRATYNDRGMLTIDDDFRIKFIPRLSNYSLPSASTSLSQRDYRIWLEQYMKFHLLANLSNDELVDFYKSRTGERITDQNEIVSFVKSLSPIDIVKHLESLYHGTVKR